MIRLRSLPVLLWLAGLTGLAADAQIAPDHHWVGFADKVGCGVDLNDPEAGRQLLSERANSLVTLLCVVGQLGSVLSFYAFVTNNVLSLLPAAVARWHVSAAMTLFTGPLVMLRTTSHPAFGAAMAFGNVAVAAALGVIVYGGLSEALRSPPRADHGELVAVDGGGLGLMFGLSLANMTLP